MSMTEGIKKTKPYLCTPFISLYLAYYKPNLSNKVLFSFYALGINFYVSVHTGYSQAAITTTNKSRNTQCMTDTPRALFCNQSNTDVVYLLIGTGSGQQLYSVATHTCKTSYVIVTNYRTNTAYKRMYMYILYSTFTSSGPMQLRT